MSNYWNKCISDPTHHAVPCRIGSYAILGVCEVDLTTEVVYSH